MNCYKVDYVLKSAGYSPGDQVLGESCYDIHHSMLVTASTVERARIVAIAYTTGMAADVRVRKPKLLMENV